MSKNIINFEWDFNAESIKDLSVGKDVAYFRLKKLMPEFIWDITHLEDNPYSFVEVQTLISGTTVGGHSLSDQSQVLNQYESLKYLMSVIKKNEFIFDKEDICRAHNIIAKNEALKWGSLRDGEVSISGTSHKPPTADKLNDILHSGIGVIRVIENPFERALAYYCFGSLNQFFYDGNKRTSRWVMNAILMSHGFNYLTVPADKKLEFNKVMVDFYNTKNATKAMRFMIECYQKD